jgi:RHS repeat-associated protein
VNLAGSTFCGHPSNAGYDELGRLIRVNCWNGSTAVWGQNFSFDQYDNISKTVPSGQTGVTWTPTYNPVTSNNQYSQATYDLNGNALTDTFHTYTWNQDNKVSAITDVGVGGILYDAFGRKVEWLTGSTYYQSVISPLGPIALQSGQTTVQYRVPLPGGDTAVNGVNFEHKDGLGSVPFVSSRSRTSIAGRLFGPYGEPYNNIGITGDLDFTGDRQDLVAGTYDTPNRELNPTAGRWATPDPAGASWNAYAYSTNPLSETDPTGLDGPSAMGDILGLIGFGQFFGGATGGGDSDNGWDPFDLMTVPRVAAGAQEQALLYSYGISQTEQANSAFRQEENANAIEEVASNGATAVPSDPPTLRIRPPDTQPSTMGNDGQEVAAPANSRTDVFLYGAGSGEPTLYNLAEWEMHWLAGTCSGTTCRHDNNQVVSGVEIDDDKPLHSIGDPGDPPKMGEANDYITIEPRTIFQWWSINGKQVQVVLRVRDGHLVTTWGVQIVVQGGIVHPPIYSSAPWNSPPR